MPHPHKAGLHLSRATTLGVEVRHLNLNHRAGMGFCIGHHRLGLVVGDSELRSVVESKGS